MRVRLLTGRVGVGFSQSAGDIIDVPVGEAEAMFAAGLAEPINKPPVETAAVSPPRNATKKRGGKRNGKPGNNKTSS